MSEPQIYWAGTSNYTYGNYGIIALFPHWTCGSFDGSVATLQNPERYASTHYVVENERVAQLVSENDSAWHCGDYYYNMRSISYELVGWPGNPPSYDTLDTCARMMAQASKDYFNGASLVLGENVMLHKWVSNTDCPGETDVDWLVFKANEYLRGEPMYPVAQPKAGLSVFRLFNPASGEHFYTTSEDERKTCIDNDWISEGAAWVTGIPDKPVYRMYNGMHFFTTDYDEACNAQKNGWVCEGVPFYSGNGDEIFRLFNQFNGDHLLTTSKEERDLACKNGYQLEGIECLA